MSNHPNIFEGKMNICNIFPFPGERRILFEFSNELITQSLDKEFS